MRRAGTAVHRHVGNYDDEGSAADQLVVVAEKASRCSGPVAPPHVITETLERPTTGDPTDATASAPDRPRRSAQPTMTPRRRPLAAWSRHIRPAARFERQTTRPPPATSTVAEASVQLAARPGRTESACAALSVRCSSWARNCRIHGPPAGVRLPAAPVSVQGATIFISASNPNRFATSPAVPIRRTRCPVTPRERILCPPPSAGSAARSTWCQAAAVQDGTYRYTSRLTVTPAVRRGGRLLFVSSELPWPDSAETAISEQRVPESWLVTQRDG